LHAAAQRQVTLLFSDKTMYSRGMSRPCSVGWFTCRQRARWSVVGAASISLTFCRLSEVTVSTQRLPIHWGHCKTDKSSQPTETDSMTPSLFKTNAMSEVAPISWASLSAVSWGSFISSVRERGVE